MKEMDPESGGRLPVPAQMPCPLSLLFTPLVFKVFHRLMAPEASLPSSSFSLSRQEIGNHSVDLIAPGDKIKLHLLCLVFQVHPLQPQLKRLVIYKKALLRVL